VPIGDDELIRLILREREELYAYCWSILRNDDLAEDIFQDVCALAVKRRDTIQNEQHLAGWFRIAVRNRCKEAARYLAARPILLDDALLDTLDNHWKQWDSAPEANRLEALRQCIERLNARGRDLLNLRYTDGLKSGDIARKINCRVETIYMRLMRLHERLRDCIENQLRQKQQSTQ